MTLARLPDRLEIVATLTVQPGDEARCTNKVSKLASINKPNICFVTEDRNTGFYRHLSKYSQPYNALNATAI
jgi:hypothetical protein